MNHIRLSKKAKRVRTDKEKLELFVNKVNELGQTKLAVNGFTISYSIHYERGQPLQSKLDQPDEADLREYLLTFRHFISENEDTFIENLLNICFRRLINGEMKRSIVQIRKAYKEVKLDNSVLFYWNNERYTPLQITNMYLNGKYFHNDLEDQQILDNLPPLSSDLFRSFFLNFIGSTTEIVFILRNNIECGLKEFFFSFEN